MADLVNTAAVAPSAPASAAVEAAVAGSTVRRTLVVTFAMLFYQGFTMAINGIAAPWIAKSFQLAESGIARVYAWISFAAIGALILSRLADRVGRRRVLLWCMAATPLCALAAAASTALPLFIIFEICLYAFIAATIASSVVLLAEALPTEQRARGQSLGGFAMGVGGGLCVLLMPILDGAGYSWRWLLILSGAGLLGLPLVMRMIPESAHWERAAASGATRTAGFSVAFGGRYRRRAVPLTVCALLTNMAFAAATSWGYFHAVSVVGLSAAATSTMILVGGGVSMLGFPLGAATCERFGRVPTVVISGLLVATGSVFFYWGPPARCTFPAGWLGAGFCWFMTAVNAATVGGNSAATELFPTAVRGTVIGWFALITAVGSVLAQGAIALLAQPLGGLSVVVGYLALLTIPSACIFGMFVDETRGLTLEVAASEVAGE